jgi:hypothetical protein
VKSVVVQKMTIHCEFFQKLSTEEWDFLWLRGLATEFIPFLLMDLVLFYAECLSILLLLAVKQLWYMLLSVVFYFEQILDSDFLTILHQTISLCFVVSNTMLKDCDVLMVSEMKSQEHDISWSQSSHSWPLDHRITTFALYILQYLQPVFNCHQY